MKKSVKYLPREKQEDLKSIVSMILERIPRTEMIIYNYPQKLDNKYQ